MNEFFIDDDGIRIHAKLEMPEGATEQCPLAIVQHGFTGHMEERHIVSVSQAMREMGMATLRVEMYGHGQTSGKFEDHTLLKWIDNMLAVVDYALSLDFVSKLVLCGHSQGGLLSMLVAALRPDDLAAIIPMSPAVVILDGAREGSLLGIPFDPHNVPRYLLFDDPALAEQGSRKAGLRLCGDYIRIAQHLHIDEAIASYDGPVLLVHGTSDTSVPVHYSIDAAEAYANADLVLLEDDDHGYHHHLDKVCQAVQDFLRRHDLV